MSRFFVQTMNVFCCVLALAVLSPAFAQTKSPYLGKSRDEVVTQLGTPKSNIRAGVREILFFPRLKLTMRNDVVVEAEDLPDDTLPAPVAPKRTTEATSAPSAQTANQLPTQGLGEAVQPPTQSTTPQNQGTNPTSSGATSSTATEASQSPASKAPEPTLSIKFIKSGSGASKSTKRPATTPATPPSTLPVTVTKSPAEVSVPPAELKSVSVVAPAPKPIAVASTTQTPPPTVTEPPEATAATEPPTTDEASAKPAVDPKKKAAVRNRWRLRRDVENEEDPAENIFSLQSYILAGIVIAGGAAFIWWRSNQRKLELAATAVSRSPFIAMSAGPADTAGMFSADLIGKLGAKKFERLVASYYAKTGVVAERTNASAEAAVHIKIFWKGEAKPFAGVQCHANPPTLLGPKLVVELFEALTAADIRRGYIVTTGKFNVEARDLAEEKHFTLLPGDIFLEKLNALPPAARGELLKETNTEEPAAPASAPTTA